MANALQRAEYRARKKFWDGMARSEKAQEKLRLSQEQTERQMKRLHKQMGDLHRKFGQMAEHLVAPGIAKRFNELGYHFDGVSPGGQKIIDLQGNTLTEVDLLLENGECIMAVEVKTTPRIKDVEHHLKRLEFLREYRNRKNDSRTIRGAIAGAIFGSEEKQAALEAGMYVLEQSGDTMRMAIPEDFVPRDFPADGRE
jgi:hypothetical protein